MEEIILEIYIFIENGTFPKKDDLLKINIDKKEFDKIDKRILKSEIRNIISFKFKQRECFAIVKKDNKVLFNLIID